MENTPIALFGEAEKGDFGTAYFFQSMMQIVDYLGNPPPDSKGLIYAIQTLLYERELLFFRVKEEGFSSYDYFHGLKFIQRKDFSLDLAAICLPGVGDQKIVDPFAETCRSNKIVMITTEADLYDYLTNIKAS